MCAFLAGMHTVIGDGTNDAGEPLPDGIYGIRMEFGAGDSVETVEIEGAFLHRHNVASYAQGMLTATDEKGRFEILLADLPIGESVRAIDENGDFLKIVVVTSSVVVYAHASAESYASESVGLGDLTSDVDIEIEFP